MRKWGQTPIAFAIGVCRHFPRHHVEAAPYRRQHAERKAIDLQQAQRVEVVLVPLEDGALRHRRVLDRDHPLEQIARDDEAADVLRQVAREAHQLARQRDEADEHRVVGLEPRLADTLGPDLAAVPPGEHAGEPIDLREVEAQRPADIAHGALRPVGDERRGERRAVAAVFCVDVLDDFLAPLVLEVDVDVRRLVALLRDEALEQHAHPRRIDLGDPERVADRRVGRRAAALAEDALRAGEGDDVVDGEKIRFVLQFRDQRELVLDQRADVGDDRGRHGSIRSVRSPISRDLSVSPRQSRFDQRAQMRCRCLPLRHDLLRVLVTQFVERERAALRDRDGLGEQLGRIDRRKPRARTQMPLAIGMKRVAALGERLFHADRRDRVLQRAPGAHVHVDVAGGDLRQARLPRQRRAVRKPGAVAGVGEELDGNPRATRKGRGDPERPFC